MAQAARHEHAVLIVHIAREWRARHKSKTSIERLGRSKRSRGPGLTTQARLAALFGDIDDVLEQGGRDEFTQMRRGCAHGLYFVVIDAQFFERHAAHQLGVMPSAPKAYARRAQSL